MKIILKTILFSLLFMVVFILFLPKEQLFIKAVNEAYKQKVYLQNYTFSEDLISSNIKNTNIIYDGINIVNIKNTDIKVWLFYNDINIKNISLDESLNSFVPSKIDNVNINYSVLNPLFVNANVKSKLFSVKINFDILNMKLNAVFKSSKFFRNKYSKLLKELKYDKKIKDYTYEYKL